MYLHCASRIQDVALQVGIQRVSFLTMDDTWYERAKKRMSELNPPVTQEDLKNPLGVETRGAVGHYLTGRRHPSPQQLLALANRLRVSVDWLLTGEDLHPIAAEPETPYGMKDEDLLARCMVLVDDILTEFRYPKKHPIWDEKYRSQLAAHAYRMALKQEGEINAGDLREKIRLVAKMA